MKIKVEKKTIEEQEITTPCFRKKDLQIAYIKNESEGCSISMPDRGSHSIHHWILFPNDWFKEDTQEATKEEFLQALEHHKRLLSDLENEMKTL